MSQDKPTYIKGENTDKYESCLFKGKEYKIKLKYIKVLEGKLCETDYPDLGPWTECEVVNGT
jgi:hypothetical protein